MEAPSYAINPAKTPLSQRFNFHLLPVDVRGSIKQRGQNPKWPYVSNQRKRGAQSEVAHKWARWLHNPCRPGVPTASERGAESQVAHKWTRWLHNPCRLGGPHRFRAGGRNKSGPHVGKVIT